MPLDKENKWANSFLVTFKKCIHHWYIEQTGQTQTINSIKEAWEKKRWMYEEHKQDGEIRPLVTEEGIFTNED